MILAYLDESGHPHPNDPTKRPVVVAACIPGREARMVNARLNALKRNVLGKERMEAKGVRLITRPTFRRRPAEEAFVEEFFGALPKWPITVFAVIMDRPTVAPDPNDTRLPDQFRFLTERVQLLAESKGEMATLLIDGDPGQLGGLSSKFEEFLHRTNDGRAYVNIADTPFFGDSRTYAGVQIADMVASVIRHYEEAEFYGRTPEGDKFLLAIQRYYRIIEQKAVDLVSPEGHRWNGLLRMPPKQGDSPQAKKETSQS